MKFTVLYEVGAIPRKVALGLRSDRGERLYLRWRVPGNWKWKALDLKGTDPVTIDRGRRAADQQLAELLVGAPTPAATSQATLTIREGLRLAIDPDTGKYPVKTTHRAEVERELERAAVILNDKPFSLLETEDLVKLWRTRIRQLRAAGHNGYRMAELLVARLLAVASWLRDRKRIPAGACHPPRNWKQDLRADWRLLAGERKEYEPHRPRHSVEDLRSILRVAHEVDPRFHLLLQLGAELRLGQVARTMRSDVDTQEWAFRPRGAGHKLTPKVALTPGQRAALEAALGEGGYLRTLERGWLEDGQDYPLFPGGNLTKGQAIRATARTLSRQAWDRWFTQAETKANIPHQEGRGAYGLRRAGVDGAKAEGVSREGLKEFGGWRDTATPDLIYADQEAAGARQEAAAVRAKIRGEDPKVTTDVTTTGEEARNP